MKKSVIAIVLILILIFPMNVSGLECKEIGEHNLIQSEPIKVKTDPNGQFKQISYVISSSRINKNSQTLYRTAEIYVDVAGHRYTVPSSYLTKNIKPEAGKTVYHRISILPEDIMAGLSEKEKAEVIDVLTNKPSEIEIKAKIEIFNGKTGEILETMDSKEEVIDRADDWGFNLNHIKDMLTRFKTKPSPVTPKDDGDKPESKGLRPSIFIYEPDED